MTTDDIFEVKPDILGETNLIPQSSPASSYYTKGRAISELKVTRTQFEQLGLVSHGKSDNPFGYPGKMCNYDKDEIDELAKHPEEIERRIKAFQGKNTKQEQPSQACFVESDDWSDI